MKVRGLFVELLDVFAVGETRVDGVVVELEVEDGGGVLETGGMEGGGEDSGVGAGDEDEDEDVEEDVAELDEVDDVDTCSVVDDVVEIVVVEVVVIVKISLRIETLGIERREDRSDGSSLLVVDVGVEAGWRSPERSDSRPPKIVVSALPEDIVRNDCYIEVSRPS